VTCALASRRARRNGRPLCVPPRRVSTGARLLDRGRGCSGLCLGSASAGGAFGLRCRFGGGRLRALSRVRGWGGRGWRWGCRGGRRNRPSRRVREPRRRRRSHGRSWRRGHGRRGGARRVRRAGSGGQGSRARRDRGKFARSPLVRRAEDCGILQEQVGVAAAPAKSRAERKLTTGSQGEAPSPYRPGP